MPGSVLGAEDMREDTEINKTDIALAYTPAKDTYIIQIIIQFNYIKIATKIQR